MVRLVFRPYTQVGRPICTSGPLRTSTRVSSGFALPRHSSPSFGSCRARSCSTSPAGRARRAGGAPAGRRRRRDPTSAGAPRPSPSLRRRVSCERPSDSRARQTPWSVFQDGSGGTPTSPRTPGARVAWALPPRRRGAGGAHWVQSAPVDSRAGSGGPRPPSPPRFPLPEGRGGGTVQRGEGAEAVVSLGPGPRRLLLPGGGCNAGRGGLGRAPRGATPGRARPPSPPGPSQPARSRSRRTAAEEMRPAGAGPAGAASPPPAPPRAPRGVGRDGGEVRQARGGRPWPAGLNPPGGPHGPHPFTS